MSKTIPPPFIPRVPDFDQELKNAIRTDIKYDQIISREEAKDPVTPKAKKAKSSTNWDEDF